RVMIRRMVSGPVQEPEREEMPRVGRVDILGQRRGVVDSSSRSRVPQRMLAIEFVVMRLLDIDRGGVAAQVDPDVVVKFAIIKERAPGPPLRVRPRLVRRVNEKMEDGQNAG